MRANGYTIWNDGYNGEWCAWFVSNCAREARIPESVIKNIVCAETDSYRKQKRFYYGKAYGGSYTPVEGDLIFFDWAYNGRNGLSDHIGIVLYTKAGKVYTIEGNSSNSVRCKSYPLDSYDVYGFAHPKYCTTHTPGKTEKGVYTGMCKNCGTPYTEWDNWGTLGASSNSRFYRTKTATETSATIKLKAYPDDDGKKIRELGKDEGLRVLGRNTRSSVAWYKVKDSKGNIGYVKASYVNQYDSNKSTSNITVTLDEKARKPVTRGTKRYITGKVVSHNPVKSITIRAENPNTRKNGVITPTVIEKTMPYKNFIFRNITVSSDKDQVKALNLGDRGAGTWTISITAVDTAGQKKTATAQVVVSDPGVAAPTITEGSYKESSGKEGKYAVVTNNAGGTLYINGKGYTETSKTIPLTSVSEEGHKIVAYAKTGDGKRSPNAEKRIKVKQCIPPEINISSDGTVIITGASGDTIKYSVNGGEYVLYKAPFKGANGAVIRAYARRDGSVRSTTAEAEADLGEPEEPTVRLLNTDKTIATGETAAFSWSKDKSAESYTVMLYKETYNGGYMEQDSLETTENTAKFRLTEAGLYYVEVTAKNGQGESTSAERAEVRAVDPLTVRFIETGETGEEKVLTELKVKYGDSPEAVQEPSRPGYTFRGWENRNSGKVSPTDYTSEKITTDTDYEARYKGDTYRVRIYAPDDKLLTTREVRHGESAVTQAVTDMLEEEGYVTPGRKLQGWSVIKTSKPESAADVEHVDSDMDIKAIVTWENTELPVEIESVETVEVTRSDGEGTVFRPQNVVLEKNADETLRFYLIASLKGTDAATGIEKTLYTDRRSFEIPAGESGLVLNAGANDHDLDLAVSDSAAANAVTKLELVAVERKADGSTGGTYSALFTKEISQNTSWTEPSKWSTERPEEKPGRHVETRTTYKYRDKVVTYSGHPTVNGIKGVAETVSTTYGRWFIKNAETSTTEDDVYTTTVTEDTYKNAKKWRAYYCDCKRVARNEKDTVTCTECKSKNSNSLVVYTTSSYTPSGTTDRGAGIFAKTITATPDGTIRTMFWNGKIESSFTTSASWAQTYLWDQNVKNDLHRQKVTKTRYRYTSWDNNWKYSETEVAANSNRQIEEQTEYRYSDQIENPPEPTNLSGKAIHIDGTLNIENDLSGTQATLMVYQANNTDPNQYQMQYTGKVDIGEGNSYDFSFIPMVDPSETSGNYIVTLGLDRTTGLVTVGTVEAPKQKYLVKLQWNDGTEDKLLGQQEVEEGSDVDLSGIDVPEKEGYEFTGWDQRTTNITGNCTVNAVYRQMQNVVVFVDWQHETVDIQRTQGSITLPAETEDAEGYHFRGWKLEDGTVKAAGETIPVSGDMVITAEYDVEKYTVRFMGTDGEAVDAQEIEYHNAANPPEYTPEEGTFVSWSTAVNWWDVEKDVDVYPVIVYDEQALMPSANITAGDAEDETSEDRKVELYLEDDECGDEIFITTDGTVPTEEGIIEYLNTDKDSYTGSIKVYTEPIAFNEDTSIMAVSYAEGKNMSDIRYVFYENEPDPEDAYSTDADLTYDEWTELGTYEVKVTSDAEIQITASVTEDPGLIGYDFMIECDDAVFYADRNEYDEPVFSSGEAVSEGAVHAADLKDGYRLVWSGDATDGITGGDLLSMILHVDPDAEEGTYPIRVSYAPANTLDRDYDPVTLENVKVTVASSAVTDIATKDVTLSRTSFVYEGTPAEPAVVIEGLREGTDFTVAYENNVDVGTGKAVVTGIGDYSGTVEKEFTITQANIANADIGEIADQTKTGSAIEPALNVTFNGNTLEKDTDYEVAYANNTEVGTATVTVSGIGNFRGTANAEFQIIETVESQLEQALREKEAAEQALKEAEKQKQAAEAEKEAAEQRAKDAEEELSTTQSQLEAAQTAADEANAAKEELETQLAGEKEISEELRTQLEAAQTAADEANARLAEAEQAKADLEDQLAEANQAVEDAERQVAEANQAREEAEKRAEEAEKALEEATQGGGNTEPEVQDPPAGRVTILNTVANSAKKTNDVIWDKSKVSGATGYEINWRARGASKWASRKVGDVSRGTTSGLTIGGLYEIRVRPFKEATATAEAAYGEWSPSVYRYFYTTQKIRLASTSKGTFTMSWARDSRATGYQVLYTTNKNGSGAAQNIKTAGASATSITVKDIKVNGRATPLRSGTTYYVQVREIRKVGNTTYIGNISCPVAVRVR
ncbi:MAG: CHAP domain-containing protein [Mogibacterium sp.]|nr:CHAP domain-containing protein [Mogibacterium sp.]